MADTLLNFIHISDTHILRPGKKHDFTNIDPQWALYAQQIMALPYDTLKAAQALVREINALPVKVDFVLHTGDVFNDPERMEDYQDVAEIFSAIQYPVYYLPGNHDRTGWLQQVLQGRDLSAPFDYEFECNGVQIVCLDSNGTNPPHSGWLDDSQLAWLEAICTSNDPRPLVVAVHHPPFVIDVSALDHLRLHNGDALHQILLKAGPRLRGVFFGHIHHPVDVLQEGILYSGASSAWYQFAGWPGYSVPSLIEAASPGFSVVTITPERTYVRRHTYQV